MITALLIFGAVVGGGKSLVFTIQIRIPREIMMGHPDHNDEAHKCMGMSSITNPVKLAQLDRGERSKSSAQAGCNVTVNLID